MKKEILILVFSNLKVDTRVKRQVDFLKDNYRLTVACLDAEPSSNYHFVKLTPPTLTLFRKAILAVVLFCRIYTLGYKLLHDHHDLVKRLGDKKFDLVIANDVETLPLAFRFKTKVFLDAHEYAPRHFEDKLWWRMFFSGFNNHLCEYYISKVVAMTTIGKGLADEYEKNFNIKPTVISNAAHYYSLDPTPVGAVIKMVHVGIANPSRKIELMIEMMKQLDPKKFKLDMLLITSAFASGKTKSYIADLHEAIKDIPSIRILTPVKSNEVVEFINQYDIGVFLIPPVNFNYANTMPNKLFEYIQARLAIAIGPSPEMASIVDRYDVGIVSKSFEPNDLADRLRSLRSERLEEYKRNTEKAAVELSAEKNKEILNALLQAMI